MPTGADLFVDTLEHLGLTQIFTLVGDHLNEVLLRAAARGIGIFDMRHESAVTHAADVWARLARRPALSLVTGGPGHTNSLTGVATAFLAGSPLIAVSGSRPSNLADRQGFQDIDQVGITRPIVKWAAEPPNAAQIPFYLVRAYSEAISGRMGAVHLTIPVDLFKAEAGAVDSPPAVSQRPAPAPAPREVEQAISLLETADRPVAIAGSGIWWADAGRELRQFAELTSLPIFTITMARGVFSDEHPLSLGYADPSLNRAVLHAFQEADLFLVLGKRIDYRLALGSERLFPREAKFIQVDIHPQELGMNRRLELAICADVKETLRALLAAGGEKSWRSRRPWLERLRAYRREWQQQLETTAADSEPPLHPAAFYMELKRALPAGTLLSWDGGDFAHWGRAILPATECGGWLRLGPLGTIGSALPNALALQLANPGRPVALITGDGSLGFYIAELDTAVRHHLPLVIIVGNDAGWGLERELQGRGRTVACELLPTRYDVVMQGFGGEGETVESLEQVRPALERAFASRRPYLLNVRIRGTRSPFTEWRLSRSA